MYLPRPSGSEGESAHPRLGVRVIDQSKIDAIFTVDPALHLRAVYFIEAIRKRPVGGSRSKLVTI